MKRRTFLRGAAVAPVAAPLAVKAAAESGVSDPVLTYDATKRVLNRIDLTAVCSASSELLVLDVDSVVVSAAGQDD